MAQDAPKPPTKTEIFTRIAEKTELSKKQVSDVFDALNDEIEAALTGPNAPQTFTLHGLCKIVLQHKEATPEREGINPFTGEPTTFKAKPAKSIVKIRPLKKLKDMVG